MKRYSDIRLNTDYEERIQNELEQQEMLERELTRLGAEPVGLTTLD